MLARAGIPVLLFVLIGFAFVADRSDAATLEECRRIGPTHRPAAASDPVVLNGRLRAGDCWNPNDNTIGQQAEAAKRYLLETRNACSGGQGITGENPSNCILKLDDDFAIKLEQLFKANPEGLFTDVKILSGYRTEEGERRVSGKTTGNHRRGCAVDLVGSHSSNRSCLRVCQFVKANSARIGLRLPYDYSPEYNHVEPTGACNGSPARAPNGPFDRTPFSRAPLGLSDLARSSMFSGQQPPPQFQQPLPPQPLSTGQPITSAFTQPQTQTQTGVSNQLATNANTNVNTNTGSNVTSVSSQLMDIAFGSSSPTSRSATSVPIVITGASAGSVAIITPDAPTSAQSTSTGGLGIVGQQTFTSNDLRWSPAQPSAFPGSERYTQLVSLYTQLRDTLSRMLEYLRPFGRPYMEHGH